MNLKYSIFILLSLLFISPIYSQASYNIDDFGTYIITDSGIKKVPVLGDESELSLFCFRGQFAVFGASNARGRVNSFILYDIENNIVESYDFDDVKETEFSFYQYKKINDRFIRYYYGGDYKKYRFHDVFFNPDLKNVPYNLENGNAVPFAYKYKYVDIIYSEQLWEKARHNYFDIETHIEFCGELNGERAVVTVYSYVLLGK
jgi:hypothetical protein